MSLTELTRYRADMIARLQSMKGALEQDEARLHDTMSPVLAKVMKGKNLLLLLLMQVGHELSGVCGC
eukprot:6481763-Amphidinium_carterae.6